MDTFSKYTSTEIKRDRTSVQSTTFRRVDIENELAMLRSRRDCELAILDAEIVEKELLLKKCDELGIE